MTKTAALAATVVAAGLGITACGSGTTTGAQASLPTQTTTSSTSATPSSSTTTRSHSAKPRKSKSSTPSKTATHRAIAKKVSRDEARPTVTTRFVTGTETVYYHTARKYDSTLAAGTSRVERDGVAGVATLTYRQQLVGNTVSRSTVVKRVVTKQPVNKVVVIGTKKATPKPTPTPTTKPTQQPNSGAGLDLSRAGMWDRIAQCESGGNWQINSGNGYYGGLQFDIGTWLSAGGGAFASRADLASRAQQITVANHVYASRGLGPWGCAGAA